MDSLSRQHNNAARKGLDTPRGESTHRAAVFFIRWMPSVASAGVAQLLYDVPPLLVFALLSSGYAAACVALEVE